MKPQLPFGSGSYIDPEYASRIIGRTPEHWDDDRRRAIGKQIVDYLHYADRMALMAAVCEQQSA
jgi:hypothetical protein